MKSPVVLVPHRSSHHAQHSGYDTLVDYSPHDQVIRLEPWGFIPQRILKLIASGLRGSNQIYKSTGLNKELKVLNNMRKTRGGLVHFLHGEQDFRVTGYWQNLFGWKSLITIHAPYDTFMKRFPKSSHFKQADGVICVGNNQVEFMKEITQKENVWYVPHGIDTKFFKPAEDVSTWNNNQILAVGQHLRDYDAFGEIFFALKNDYPNLQAKVVLRPDFAHMVPKHKDIELLHNIDDETLRHLYQSSAFLLLPLKDSTACNSLLESLACGLPIVTNDVGGNRGYLNDEASFIGQNIQDMITASKQLLDDHALNLKLRHAARQLAHDYTWERIAEQFEKIYADVCST